jgi:isoleucyl-tRNA synthetase
VTPALRSEGLSRELVSRIQRLRKECGFAVSDRIALNVVGNPEIVQVVAQYRDAIAGEVLAVALTTEGDPPFSPEASRAVDLDGSAVHVAMTRV